LNWREGKKGWWMDELLREREREMLAKISMEVLPH
jgi:hypothetical protein